MELIPCTGTSTEARGTHSLSFSNMTPRSAASSSASSSQCTRITFSPAFLERNGLSHLCGAAGPFTLSIDQTQVRTETPCVVTIRNPNLAKPRKKQPQDQDQKPQNERGGKESATVEETDTKLLLKEQIEKVEQLEKDHREVKDALQKALSDLHQKESENHQLQDELKQVAEAATPMQNANRSFGTQTDTDTDTSRERKDELDRPAHTGGVDICVGPSGKEEEEDDVSLKKVVEVYATCFFDKCVTQALRNMSKPMDGDGGGSVALDSHKNKTNDGRADLHQEAEDLEQVQDQGGQQLPLSQMKKAGEVSSLRNHYEQEMVKVLSSYFFQQFASQAERDLIAAQVPVKTPGGTGDRKEEEEPKQERQGQAGGGKRVKKKKKPERSFPALETKSREDLEKELLWTMQALSQRMHFLESQPSALN